MKQKIKSNQIIEIPELGTIQLNDVNENLAKLTAQLILDSTFYFTKIILKRDLLTEEQHLEVCNFLDNDQKAFKLVLMPRGTFKSTIVTFGYVIKRIIQNPNIRILIASENYSNALDCMRKVKYEFEQNEELRYFYGNFVSKTGWREDYFTVSKRKVNEREPTVMCAGVEKTVVGYHYDLIIGDDLVSKNNVSTADQIKKVIDFYKDFNNLLDRTKKRPEIIICGTRWHFSDLYQHIIDNEKQDFAIYNVGAYKDDGSLRFPNILNYEELERLRRSQGSYYFACNYLNNPVDEEHAIFKKDWIKYYSIEQGKYLIPQDIKIKENKYYSLENCRLFMHIDPATSDKKRGDFSAFIVSAISPDDLIYVLEAKREKINLTELIDLIFKYYEKYPDVKKILIETQATQQMIKFPLFEEQKKRRIYLPIEEIQHQWFKKKEDRIRGLVPRFEFGTIFIKPDMKDLEDELLRFPVAQHDDLIDALSFGLAYWKRPTVTEKKNIPKLCFKKLLADKKREKDLFKEYISKSIIWS